MVLKAIFDKATSPEIIVNYPSLLSALESAFDTTLSQDEITSFIKYQIQAMPGWKFETYQLSGEGSTLFCPSLGQAAYVTVLDQNTVALAHDKIMAVLDGKDADEITEPQTQANDEAAVYPENQAGYDFYDNEGAYSSGMDSYDEPQWDSQNAYDAETDPGSIQDEYSTDDSHTNSEG